jgi:hypothetical protein
MCRSALVGILTLGTYAWITRSATCGCLDEVTYINYIICVVLDWIVLVCFACLLVFFLFFFFHFITVQ